MTNYTTYIIFSEFINRFYVGSTSLLLEKRLQRHNSNHKGFTGKANDWRVVFKMEFDNVSASRNLESKIKGRGAKRFISDLI